MIKVFISHDTATSIALQIEDELIAHKINVILGNSPKTGTRNVLLKPFGAIIECDVLIVLIQAETHLSNWIQREIDIARGSEIVILPIVITNLDVSSVLDQLVLTDYLYLRFSNIEDLPKIVEVVKNLAPITQSRRENKISKKTLEEQNHKVLEQMAIDIAEKALENLMSKNRINSEATNPILGQVATAAKFQCSIFMIMPFREHLNPVYTDHIKKLAESLSYSIKRGDDPFSHHDIITEIWSLINNARLIIADCTDKNANVFYEMGLAHAIGKPVIVITQNEEDIPFDIRQRRFIKYEYTPRGMKQLENELTKAIRSILGESN